MSNKPDWKDAPDFAEWLAQDHDGQWWWHQNKPRAHTGLRMWTEDSSPGLIECASWVGKSVKNENWKSSREPRP